jgi:hypothetical protein
VAAKRKTESKLWEDFNKDRPKILGAIYTAISTAIKNLPDASSENLPRLADCAQWVCAAEPATGLATGSILSTYIAARDASVKELLDTDAVRKVTVFAEEEKKWQGTGKELAIGIGLDSKFDIPSDKEVREFVSDLRTLQTVLESQGVLVSFRRSHGKKLIHVNYKPTISAKA